MLSNEVQEANVFLLANFFPNFSLLWTASHSSTWCHFISNKYGLRVLVVAIFANIFNARKEHSTWHAFMDVLGTESSEHLLIHLLNVKSVKKTSKFSSRVSGWSRSQQSFPRYERYTFESANIESVKASAQAHFHLINVN